jgi:hypothetical protein
MIMPLLEAIAHLFGLFWLQQAEFAGTGVMNSPYGTPVYRSFCIGTG